MADVKEKTSADISEEELKTEIEKILKDADLATTYTKSVIQKLEKNLGIELKDKKKMIDQMVMDYVNSQDSDNSAEESGGDSEDSDEPRPKRKQQRATRSGSGKSNVDNDEEEEERPKKRKKKGSDDNWGSSGKKAAPKTKAKKAAGGRGKSSGYTRAYKLSPALSELMGKDEMPRHEVVKRVWEIIKEKQLYDPNNKQFAICDDALLKVFGTKRFRTFGMMKYLKTHFLDE
ncbi:uncharacterized protein LOC126377206 [Pectinophora gossypiella]|uniref:Uncharacterized protein n=1 Tax=Pectinophora gossypiella TaxID=13191 RepID=A0A1E1W285_PECGO|nr:uncharacterized protein LOC126377206 [Pectinophora gossypiella]XP_049880861.1 uncharacterized protein LOC126377206 [Pectinophora gossypiella]